MHLESLHANNTLLFTDVAFDFTATGTGLTVIHGLNKNSKTLSDTNRTGKSAFFGLIHEVAFDEPLNGNRKDKRRSGSVVMQLKRGKAKYTIQYSNSAKGTGKYTIYKDGQDLEIKRSADAKREIAKIMGRTPDQFRVIDYLDNRLPNVVRSGDTGSRREFFSEFFDLGSIDVMKETVHRRLADIKEVEAQISELSALYMSSEKRITDATEHYAMHYSGQKIAKANELLEKRRDRLSRCKVNSDESTKLPADTRQTIEDYIKSILGSNGGNNADSTAKLARKLNKQLEYLNQRYAALSSLSDFGLVDIENKELQYTETQAQEHLGQCADKLTALDQMVNGLHEQRAELRRLTKALATLKRDNPTECPTCRRPFDKRHTIEDEAQSLTDQIAILPDDDDLQAQLGKMQSRIEKHKKMKAALSNYIAGYTTDIGVAADQIKDKLDAMALKSRKDAELKAAATTMLSVLNLKVSDVAELYSDAPAEFAALFKKTDGDVEDNNPEALNDAIEDLTRKINEVQEYLSEAAVAKAVIKSEKASLATMGERLSELRAKVENKAELQLIYKGYASTATSGIRTTMLRNIVSKLEDVINGYASQIFPEVYAFKFDLDSQSAFQILCSRVDAKTGKTLVSDVRKLSGAESSIFDILFSLALRSFLPKSRRSNVMILDEINANFGEHMQGEFKKLLAVLTREIQHIVLITPRSQDHYEGAEYMTMVRKGHAAKLVSGAAAGAMA